MDRKTKGLDSLEINITPELIRIIILLLIVSLILSLIIRLKKITKKTEPLFLSLLTCFAAYIIVFFGQDLMLIAFIPFLVLWACAFFKLRFADN